MNNTTKNVRHIVNKVIQEKGIQLYGTWTDAPGGCTVGTNKRYLTWNVGFVDQDFLDCVNKYFRLNGIPDTNARVSFGGYLKVNSYLD